MTRAYYSNSIKNFRTENPDQIIGQMARNHPFALEELQRRAWEEEISILQNILQDYEGSIYFEYSIPRMGKRIDVLLLIGSAIFVLEFKVGEEEYTLNALDQVWDYSLDLKNFHETSHDKLIAPVLIPTEAPDVITSISTTPQNDKLLFPIKSNVKMLKTVIDDVLAFSEGECIDKSQWESGRYCPTPNIIEAAMALYKGHSVSEISRSDAGAINLTTTSDVVSEIIRISKENKQKSICFVTGVPGAGKTLVGLNIATQHIDPDSDLYSVYLSGNGPLVAILREALARDKVQAAKDSGTRMSKKKAMSEVQAFIQNVHHFRDDCLVDENDPPIEHVALFDEAQRAWNMEKTADFMKRKKGRPDFNVSEPEFLISCLDRHEDWAVVVCLVGGGQEIHLGEAGISAWIEALNRSYPDWRIYVSDRLTDSEYGADEALKQISHHSHVNYEQDLHLGVSLRSFRAENVSLLIKQILDLNVEEARETLKLVKQKYPIMLTRDIHKAKDWIRKQARGTERYGLLVSSQAERLKPYAIDVKAPMDPIHWFLDGKEDVRSSYYLESVATEFDVQGLELDWACVTWDADFRYSSEEGWEHRSFRGSKWTYIRKAERKQYLKNAYRVLLTRARQGMVIVVPPGDKNDPTRNPCFYDPTYEYLKKIGFDVI